MPNYPYDQYGQYYPPAGGAQPPGQQPLYQTYNPQAYNPYALPAYGPPQQPQPNPIVPGVPPAPAPQKAATPQREERTPFTWKYAALSALGAVGIGVARGSIGNGLDSGDFTPQFDFGKLMAYALCGFAAYAIYKGIGYAFNKLAGGDAPPEPNPNPRNPGQP